jgi:hypothetical protein
MKRETQGCRTAGLYLFKELRLSFRQGEKRERVWRCGSVPLGWIPGPTASKAPSGRSVRSFGPIQPLGSRICSGGSRWPSVPYRMTVATHQLCVHG